MAAIAAALVLGIVSFGFRPSGAATSRLEVWSIDQSGTAGTLYIYDGGELDEDAASAVPEVIGLDALCPGAVRGHMLEFNGDHTQAILSFVGSGHVLFLDAETRAPVECIDVGVQAHAAMPSHDDTYVIVADQNGKKLHRIVTDADGDGQTYERAADIALDPAASLDLATCTTPSGGACQDATLRPDNAPICPIVDFSSRLAFVTLRGGGLFVVDPTATPISIVAEYDKETIHPNGCGGLQIRNKMYINSGGSGESHLYTFNLRSLFGTPISAPNTPAPEEVFSKHGGAHDAHGMAAIGAHRGAGARFVWVADRFSNEIEVVDTRTDELINTFSLTGAASADPAPDLLAFAPGGRAFVSLRGQCPLTANSAATNNAVGSTPGVGVIAIRSGGRSGQLLSVAPIVNPAPAGFDCSTRTDDAPGSIGNQADPHGLAVRVVME